MNVNGKKKESLLPLMELVLRMERKRTPIKVHLISDKDLNTLVETLKFEKSGVVVKRHLVLDAERGLLSGFPVEPQLPEGIDMK